MNKNTGASLPGTAEKIIQSPLSNAPDKSQIKVLGAAHDRRGIRIDNPLTNENGEEVSIKMSAQVNLLSEQACGTILGKS
jgi:hypothetical protein